MTHEALPRWVGALAGGLAGAAALAVGELAAALTVDQPGPVTSVAHRVRDGSPPWFTRWAITSFGTADKPMLLAGVAAVAVALAVWLGARSARRPLVGVAGIVAFGALGAWSMAAEASGRVSSALVIASVSVLAGVATLLGLLHAAGTTGGDVALQRADGPPIEDPRLRRGNRRSFLTASGLAGAGIAAAAAAGRNGRGAGTAAGVPAVALAPPVGAAALSRRIAGARSGTVADTPGLSPLITANDDFYRIDTALFVPRVDVGSWRLTVGGMVERNLSYTYRDLVERATTLAPVTLACVSNEVGGDLVGTAVWQGIPLGDLLAEAGVDPAATQLVGRSVDGWTAGFPTSVASDGRTALLAVGMNGEPLPMTHGFPARLVVAGLFGYVSATKWLKQIELTTWEDFDAYWVRRGWSKEGPVKTQSRIDTPRRGRTLAAGTHPVAGVAWAPDRGIDVVQVQVDDGPWRQAHLGPRLDDDTWVQWRLDWAATPGRHRLRVRATDRTGATQDEAMTFAAPDGATGWHAVEVEVR